MCVCVILPIISKVVNNAAHLVATARPPDWQLTCADDHLQHTAIQVLKFAGPWRDAMGVPEKMVAMTETTNVKTSIHYQHGNRH